MSASGRRVVITVHLPEGDAPAFVSLVGVEGFQRMRREYARLRARPVDAPGRPPRGVPLDLWVALWALGEVVAHYEVEQGS